MLYRTSNFESRKLLKQINQVTNNDTLYKLILLLKFIKKILFSFVFRKFLCVGIFLVLHKQKFSEHSLLWKLHKYRNENFKLYVGALYNFYIYFIFHNTFWKIFKYILLFLLKLKTCQFSSLIEDHIFYRIINYTLYNIVISYTIDNIPSVTGLSKHCPINTAPGKITGRRVSSNQDCNRKGILR